MVAIATGRRRWTSGEEEDDRSVLESIDPLFYSTRLASQAFCGILYLNPLISNEIH